MKNLRLVDLNFREVLGYGKQPTVEFKRKDPAPCLSYCVRCEEDGVLLKAGGRLDLISHGCDSEDYEHILGPMPLVGDPVNEAVMFVLEDPGGDWDSGEIVEYHGFSKKPPSRHYYWAPNCTTWPKNLKDLNNVFYGPYFAYLMCKHGMRNVYITNTVKCRWKAVPGVRGVGKRHVVKHCTQYYLKREIEAVAPVLLLCFGGNAYKNTERLARQSNTGCIIKQLLHPSYIRNRCHVHGRTKERCIDINDEKIRDGVRKI